MHKLTNDSRPCSRKTPLKADCVTSFVWQGMSGTVRARYTLECKQESSRLVRAGRSIGTIARSGDFRPYGLQLGDCEVMAEVR